MKQFLILFLCAGLLAGCSDEVAEPVVEQTPVQKSYVSEVLRTPDEAIEIAQRAVSMIADATPASRTGVARRVDANTPVRILTASSPAAARVKARSVDNPEVSDTLLYVVNYADNMGFALVSAPRTAPELLAVTVSGNYDPAEPTDNPGFNLYMDCATQYLQECAEEAQSSGGTIPPGGFPITPMPNDYIIQDTIWHKHIPNRVRVFWGQHFPEGDLCPNKTSGCSITALAMLLSGFKYPSSIQLTYKDNSRINLFWDKLCLHDSFDQLVGYKTGNFVMDKCSGIDDYDIHGTISQLCRELGHRSQTNYDMDTHQSGTVYQNVMSTLQGLGGFDVSYHVCSEQSISDDMYMNTILLVRGKNSDGVGHMWVCDAVKSYHFHYRWYRSEGFGAILPGHEPNLPLYKEWDDAGGIYNFFNWGVDSYQNVWSGSEAESNADKCGYFYDMNFGKYGIDAGYILVKRI